VHPSQGKIGDFLFILRKQNRKSVFSNHKSEKTVEKRLEIPSFKSTSERDPIFIGRPRSPTVQETGSKPIPIDNRVSRSRAPSVF
jgi:hypothetical protein